MAKKTQQGEAETKGVEAVSVSVPIFTGPLVGYRSRRPSVSLEREEADTLRRISLALEQNEPAPVGARGGWNPQQTLRWLLRQVGETQRA